MATLRAIRDTLINWGVGALEAGAATLRSIRDGYRNLDGTDRALLFTAIPALPSLTLLLYMAYLQSDAPQKTAVAWTLDYVNPYHNLAADTFRNLDPSIITKLEVGWDYNFRENIDHPEAWAGRPIVNEFFYPFQKMRDPRYTDLVGKQGFASGVGVTLGDGGVIVHGLASINVYDPNDEWRGMPLDYCAVTGRSEGGNRLSVSRLAAQGWKITFTEPEGGTEEYEREAFNAKGCGFYRYCDQARVESTPPWKDRSPVVLVQYERMGMNLTGKQVGKDWVVHTLVEDHRPRVGFWKYVKSCFGN